MPHERMIKIFESWVNTKRMRSVTCIYLYFTLKPLKPLSPEAPRLNIRGTLKKFAIHGSSLVFVTSHLGLSGWGLINRVDTYVKGILNSLCTLWLPHLYFELEKSAFCAYCVKVLFVWQLRTASNIPMTRRRSNILNDEDNGDTILDFRHS